MTTRVVITGFGIVSSLGNSRDEVAESLHAGRSGIVANAQYAERGLKSQVCGAIEIDLDSRIDRRLRRFMGDSAAYGYVAMEEAIAHARLSEAQVAGERTGLLMGTGGGSPENVVLAADTARDRGVRRVGPYMVTRTMASTVTACLSTAFRIKGVSYAISSACATSAHCIGHGAELIQMGKQDVVFAGGGEELHWTTTILFDGMGALSSRYNDRPSTASRPYDADRDGFVISGGAGVVVLESLEHAKSRGAPILAELVGYGAASDGHDMVAPSQEGGIRCMRQALAGLDRPVQYINAHATSTPVGDLLELKGIEEVFNGSPPPIGATKSLSGHALGAAGVNELIYTLIMMERRFISASAHIENLDPGAANSNIVTERQDDVDLEVAMSNSFGFGGANCTLVVEKWNGEG